MFAETISSVSFERFNIISRFYTKPVRSFRKRKRLSKAIYEFSGRDYKNPDDQMYVCGFTFSLKPWLQSRSSRALKICRRVIKHSRNFLFFFFFFSLQTTNTFQLWSSFEQRLYSPSFSLASLTVHRLGSLARAFSQTCSSSNERS